MNALAVVFGAGLAAALGKLYLDSKDSADREKQAALQQQLLQQQVLQQQLLAQQYANAPVSAPPTQQGQTAGGSAASIIDGILGLISLI